MDNIKKIKIGYFADGPWAHNAFQKMINDDSISIEFICVRYDTEDLTLYNYAKQYEIAYLKHKNINSKDFRSSVASYNCDLFVSMSFNQIFKTKIINIPPLKSINCHAGLLPFYRGRNILNWVLINDEKEFGITVHYIDKGIDTGDIIFQKKYTITDDDNYKTLLNRAYVGCAETLYHAVKLIQRDEVVVTRQAEIHPVGFYCSMRKEGDEFLNINMRSREIFNFVRSICKPGPMARILLNGKEMKLNKVEMIANAPVYKGISGAVLGKDKDGFIMKTGDSSIKVLEYEYEGVVKVGDRFQTISVVDRRGEL